MKLVNLLLLCSITVLSAAAQQREQFRPPSVPLVTHDPYFSIWSPADRLTDRETVHWTGTNHPLHCMIRVDDVTYRVMGSEPSPVMPLKQTALTVLPTATVYEFESPEIRLKLRFTSPLLPDDLDLLSRPITYITWELSSRDGKKHTASIYFDAGSELAVNTNEQKIVFEKASIPGLTTIRFGNPEQPVLDKRGDNVRIDWGYAYVAAAADQAPATAVAPRRKLMDAFAGGGTLPPMELPAATPVKEGNLSAAFVFNLGELGKQPVARTVLIGYDDCYSIRYFENDLRPWWRRSGATMEQVLTQAAAEQAAVLGQCDQFNRSLAADLAKAGGSKYAAICSLVYRQCLAAHKLTADANGMPLLFPKENFSNGCIATVDVIYPASPFYLLFSPALSRAVLQPVFAYAESKRWKFPFAPHDLGTYPHATGQAYGGGEETEDDQMPVEETGNMLIMTAALARIEGSADFAKEHWGTLERWTGYLVSKGFDPENQLCTDDFAGHLAHNINLSAKAILAIGSYSRLCAMLGLQDKAQQYRVIAESMAQKWAAQAGEGNHTKLAYDRPNTWSQKYNLVWDRLLELNLFPSQIARREITYYKTRMASYGLPLDSRERYSKNDWITWTATMADNLADFRALFDPVYDFAQATPQRIPLTDWYNTDNAYHVGFQARSVVGGLFIKMLQNKNTWRAWVARGTNVSGTWAPLKLLKTGALILPNAKAIKTFWKYTLEKPSDDWNKSSYSDSLWKTGTAAFGSADYRTVSTVWTSEHIWIRKEFTLKEVSHEWLAMDINYNDDAEVFINGVPCGAFTNPSGNYRFIKLGKRTDELLHPGKNLIAIHCRWTANLQHIDAGLVEYKTE